MNNRTFDVDRSFVLPYDLTSRPQWIVWRYVSTGNDKPGKVPTNPTTGGNLTGYTEGNGWMPFNDAVEAFESCDALAGIGFVLSADDGLIGIDMDHCIDPDTGEVAEWARDHVTDLATYTELSPSGTGLRAFVCGELPKGHPSRAGHRELYTQGRFLTVTGNTIEGAGESLAERPEAVARYVAAMRPKMDSTCDHSAAQAKGDTIAEGQRDSTLASLAGSMRRRGMGAESIAAALSVENAEKCAPPLPEADIERIARSVARYEPSAPLRDMIHGAQVAERLGSDDPANDPEPFDLEAATVGELLATEPPPRHWLVDEWLPLGVVGLLAAAGGTGKSMATLQLSISVATGMPWLDMPMGEAGGVLMVSAEDDRDEMHRRLRAVVSEYRARCFGQLVSDDDPAWQTFTRDLIDRLHIVDRVGDDNMLTDSVGGQVFRTKFASRVAETARRMGRPKLIILDPLSRFDGGEPNDNADGTRLVESAEAIRKETGATVLLPHHVSKAPAGSKQRGQEAVRGASGLVDGARWVGLMETLDPANAKNFGIEPDDAGQYIRLTTPKANYSAPRVPIWLHRQQGGFLAPVELQAVPKGQRTAAQDEARYERILPDLVELVERKSRGGRPLTANKVKTFAGTANRFGVSEGVLLRMLTRAIEEGAIIEKPAGKRSKTLHAPDQETEAQRLAS